MSKTPESGGRSPMRGPRYGLARVLSKRGYCSRSEAERLIVAGRVRVDGRLVRDPEAPTDPVRALIRVDDAAAPVAAASGVYLALNKPRGLVTTARDERGRDTVFRCLEGAGLPYVAPVGRLDQASEGLLLFTNDPGWAAGITSPESALLKTYRVQVDAPIEAARAAAIAEGVRDGDTFLGVHALRILRANPRTTWLEIELDEGRNRHIRRLLGAHGLGVLRLIRVAIGPLELGALPKGAWRPLAPGEVAALRVRA
ncbi:pseudouridine synthase [Coralloluteibacterium thermophilus]|uniref:Pseudouridine synthase n=1 Tax=Coralloluteibacterium thermophilum TaxID=2707049 RepID=A0ABV9NN61_9GAMM